MSRNIFTGRNARIAGMGHVIFAATFIGLGVAGLIRGDFTAIWQPVPADLIARAALAHVCALVCLVSGLGLFWTRAAASASRLLLVCLVFWMLLFKVRAIVHAPAMAAAWESCGETAVLVSAAAALRARLAGSETSMRFARVLFGLALIAFGYAHFAYLAQTAALVPAWLPWHAGWAAFFGVAYIAAGLAMLSGARSRLAAALVAVQMGLFTLLVWIPTVTSGHASASDWSELVVSWALTAGAWVMADSLRGARDRGRGSWKSAKF